MGTTLSLRTVIQRFMIVQCNGGNKSMMGVGLPQFVKHLCILVSACASVARERVLLWAYNPFPIQPRIGPIETATPLTLSD